MRRRIAGEVDEPGEPLQLRHGTSAAAHSDVQPSDREVQPWLAGRAAKRGEQKVERGRGPSLVGVEADDPQELVEIPGDQRMLRTAIELVRVVREVLVALDDPELGSSRPSAALPPVDRRERPVHLGIGRGDRQCVVTGVHCCAETVGSGERAGPGDEAGHVVARARDLDTFGDVAQLIGDCTASDPRPSPCVWIRKPRQGHGWLRLLAVELLEHRPTPW